MLNAYLALRALPWKLIGLGALALAFLALGAALKIERSQNAKLKAQITACSEARKADRSAYQSAQAEAARLNLEHVRKVETEQRRINDEQVQSLNARLERLRSELRKAASSDQGSADGAGSSQAGGGAGAAGSPRMCLASEDYVRAAENEERHDQLITLVERLIANQR